LEDLGVDESTILKYILMKLFCEGVDWTHLAHDMDNWREGLL